MPVTDIKRPNFYEGQYLGAADLVAAQEYQRQQDQRHRLAAHTWGIHVGLELEESLQPGSTDAVDVYVKPGYATDGFGRAIVVLQPYKITEALFAQFRFDPVLSAGIWVPVWLRYREEKTNPPAPGFALCDVQGQTYPVVENCSLVVGDVEEQAYRVLENFLPLVGEKPLIKDQRDKIFVAGKSVDAAEPNLPIPPNVRTPDASVPYQELPDTGDKARWLIRLGSVRWLPPNPPATTAGHFVISAAQPELEKTREGRPYIGVVAETVLAPAAKIRIRDRFKAVIPANETTHLAAVEGSLRIEEDLHVRRGKAGIGTLAPEQNLSVNAALNVDQANANNGTVNPGITFGSASGEGIASKRTATGNQFGLDFYTASTARVAITNAGDVGIGTLVPSRMLHVADEVHSSGTRSGFSFGDRTTPGVFVDTPTAGERWVWYALGGKARLWSGGDKLAVTPAGNVGVGNLDPQARLHVVGDIALDSRVGGAPLALPANGTMMWNDGTWLRLNQNLDYSKPILGVHTPGVFAPNSLNVGGAGGWGDPGAGNVWVTGNVGIGTNAPATKLHVTGDRIRLESPDKSKKVDLRADGSSVDLYSDTNDLYVHSSGPGGKNKLLLNPFGGQGYVGIGTLTPGYKLDVAGVAHATSHPNSSDDRFKCGIVPLEDVLEKLRTIRGVSFEWNEKYAALGRSSGKRELGVLAQEVEAVFPELISRWGDEQYLAVDYGRLGAVLLEAVKDLAAQNAALSSRLGTLEKRIAAREKRGRKRKHETKT